MDNSWKQILVTQWGSLLWQKMEFDQSCLVITGPSQINPNWFLF